MVYEQVFNSLRNSVDYSPKEVVLIGVLGKQGAGKTWFNREFSEFLADKDLRAIEWNADMYTTLTRPEKRELMKGLRGKDPDWVGKVFCNYDKPRALDHMVRLRNREGFSSEGMYNQKTGEIDLGIKVDFSKGSMNLDVDEQSVTEYGPLWVLFDSDFLSEDQFRRNLEGVVYLDAPREVRIKRVAERCRNLNPPFELDNELFNEIDDWMEKYFVRHQTPRNGDIVVDNTDFSNRKVVIL